MFRFILVAVGVVVAWLLVLKLSSQVRNANVDWTGWAFFAGFIALAFWLDHVTGLG